MADAEQKPQHEKLLTLYGQEACGKSFRLIGDSWERFKSHFNFREEDVFARRVDTSKAASVDGNFEVYERSDKGEGTWKPARYGDYDYYVVKTVDGKEYRGHLVSSDGAPWDAGNFVVDTTDGAKVVSWDMLDEKPEHVQRLKCILYQPVSLLESTKIKDKPVQRVKLELTKTASEALSSIVNAIRKADGDPNNFAFTISYVEADKQYVIKEEDYRKLTDEEKASGAEEDEAAKSTSLAELPPPAPFGDSGGIDLDSINF